ncbi:MAG: hypothetical protein ACRDL5_07520, partial [Solirubrobacteraceae bacterium]
PYVEDDDGELPYAELRARADCEEFEEVGGPLWFASVEHLIAMKLHAGRDEDLRDVSVLRWAVASRRTEIGCKCSSSSLRSRGQCGWSSTRSMSSWVCAGAR